MTADQTLTYNYTFKLENEAAKTFDVHLDDKTLSALQPQRDSHPEWTALSCCKCPNCPLDEEEHPHCPIAVNLVEPVEFFKAMPSYQEIDVRLETDERTYTKQTTVQKGLSSLLGIYMVTSGCPVMDKLRPMVRFHLPFATPQETAYRAVAMYLLAQYFLHRRGKEPDWELKDLIRLYEVSRL